MQRLYDFFSGIWNDITTFIDNFWIWLLDILFMWMLDLIMYFTETAFSIFTTLVTQLSFDQYLVSAASALDPRIGFVFGALGIGAYIQIIFSAYITRFVMKVTVPFY